MTNKYVGNIDIAWSDHGPEICMPKETNIPPKQDWHNYAIWEFNGRRYRPVTQKAEYDLINVVKNLESNGYTHATKPGKIKPSSLKYAICTQGVEDFTLVK